MTGARGILVVTGAALVAALLPVVGASAAPVALTSPPAAPVVSGALEPIDLSWTSTGSPPAGYHRFGVLPLGGSPSFRLPGASLLHRETYKKVAPPREDDGGWYTCQSYDDPGCTGKPIRFTATLPPCTDTITSGCVRGVGFIRNGRDLDASLARTLDFGGALPTAEQYAWKPSHETATSRVRIVPVGDFTGRPAQGLPPGGKSSLWEVPGITDGANEFMLVDVAISGLRTADGEVIYQTFQARVAPVVKQGGLEALIWSMRYAPAIKETVTPGLAWDFDVSYRGDPRCMAFETGACLRVANMPDDLRVSLDLALDKRISGWLHGRLSDPVVDVTEVDAFTNRVTIEAGSAEVPAMIQDVESDRLPGWGKKGAIGGFRGWNFFPSTGFFREFVELVPLLKQVSTAEYRVWNFTSIVNEGDLHPCLADRSRLMGLVTTNALFYGAQPPTLRDSALRFQVAGLHRTSKGSLTRGTYDLVMRADAARCIYDLTGVPMVAQVSVTTENGEEQVASTSAGEDNGWLRISARNFTFSAPTVSAHLLKRGDLLCRKMKGKKIVGVKVVPGPKARCPRGFTGAQVKPIGR